MYLRRPKFVVVLFTPHQKFGERKRIMMMLDFSLKSIVLETVVV